MPAPRRRRTADVARHEILEAAERRLAQSGPQGLRLQDVAADVGISHPSLLDHFGGRGGRPDGAAMFRRVYETLFDRGYGRLMAWLLLAGYDPFNETARANWARIGEVAHGVRVKRFKGKRKPAYEDTMFAIVLSALVLFGQSIAGKSTLRV